MAAEALQRKLAEAQGSEMDGQLSDVAEEVASFFNEFMRLLNAKNDKDIDQLRAAINELELRRIVEKLRVKYRAEKAAAQVSEALVEGVEMRKKFDDVDEMKRKIAALKQSVISEIRSGFEIVGSYSLNWSQYNIEYHITHSSIVIGQFKQYDFDTGFIRDCDFYTVQRSEPDEPGTTGHLSGKRNRLPSETHGTLGNRRLRRQIHVLGQGLNFYSDRDWNQNVRFI